MVGKRQKPADQLQGWGSRYRGSVPPAIVPLRPLVEAPPCPRGLTRAARRWYLAYCASEQARLIAGIDWPDVARLATLLSRRERVEHDLWLAPTVAGRMGQRVVNPLLSLVQELNREIERLEAALGVLPLNRMRLGIASAQAQLGLDDIRRRLDEGPRRRRVFGEGADDVIDMGALDDAPDPPA